MKLLLSDEDIIKLVYNGFVDGGLSILAQCEVGLRYSEKNYKAARKAIDKPTNGGVDSVCFEDVLVELFKRDQLSFYDHNEGQSVTFTLVSVRNNLNDLLTGETINEEAIEDVLDILIETGDYDAYTCFNVLQYMLFKEIVYN